MRRLPSRTVHYAAAVIFTVLLAFVPVVAQVPSTRPGVGAIPYTGGTTFRTWAPFAQGVAAAGTFNNWSTTANRLASEGGGGGWWSADVTGAIEGSQYKFVITNGSTIWKNDPRARELTSSVGNSIVRGDTFDWSVRGPVVTLFSDGFENPVFSPLWYISGTGDFRVRTSTQYRATGTRGCTLDRSPLPALLPPPQRTNQTTDLTLLLDLSGYDQLTLTYKIRNIGDEKHPNDGVFISNDSVSWKKVDSFPIITSFFWTRTINLSAAAANAGYAPGTKFQIRWQEYDDFSLPTDGVVIDDVAITGRLRAPAYSTPPWNEMVIYELHVGTFNDTPGGAPGTFNTAIQRLDQLRDLGINAIEIMPVNEFPGDFSWGYNPSYPYAVEGAYGGMNEYKRFISECHARGIAVIQDVVHNHWGPNDMDLWRFDGWSSGTYGGIFFYNDNRAVTPWGNTRPDYGRPEVRSYIRDNALMWLQEFRADGLRWDSTVNIRNTNNGQGADIPDGWSLMQWANNEVDASQGWKLMLAEDLQNNEWITKTTGAGGAGFDTQADAQYFHPMRYAIITQNDADRSMFAVRDAITHSYNGQAFQRVIYTESHDEVANGRSRVPEEIWPGNAGSWYSKKRSTLGAAITCTSPGIPMIFQGQEVLEDGFFADSDPVDWSKLTTYAGIQLLYRDLIRLRRDWYDTTRGLRGEHTNVFHVNNTNKVIAYHRWENGGPRDDVVVVANFGNTSYTSYNIGLPRGGTWRVRFNSDWNGYSPDFANTNSFDAEATAGAADGLPFHGSVGIGPYTVIILSQD